jgi:hypothetical protein
MRMVGSTSERTLNRVILEQGQMSNVYCGADILLSGLYQNVKGEAICPICKTKIQIALENQAVTKVIPSTSLLHYVVEDPSVLSICCEGTIIFDKEPCLKMWLKSHRETGGVVSSLPDFMNLAISRRTTK